MEALKAQFARMQEQLAGLSATQRMLTGSLVAIMVLTMMLWARYASNAEMVPVLDQPFDDQEIASATTKLDAVGIETKVVGDRVQVPADKQRKALAILSYDRLLPANTKSGFDEILKQTNLFDPEQKNDLMFTRAKAAELAQIISSFPGVGKADVVINPARDRYIGNELKPSGVVSIQTRGDADIKHLVESAASTVASATAGMDRSRVSVIIGNKTYKAHDDNDTLANGDLDERLQTEERYYQEKIAKGLENYSNPLITVSVDLESQSSVETTTRYDAAGTVQKEKSTDSQTEETTQTAPAAEPGVVANSGLSLASSGSGGTNTSTERNKTEFEVFPGQTVSTTQKPAGRQTVVSAAVALPRSYFVDLYRRSNGPGKDPDEVALQKMAQPELARVKKSVQAACGLKSDASVFVDLYADSPVTLVSNDASASAASTAGVAVTGHIKEIAIGVLALLSLFMVSMMVRKSSPAPALAVAQEETREAPSFIDGDEEIAGIVGGSQNTMDGMELDDESVKAQQMVEQVTTMVQENPDAAATLVKRWMNRA